MENAITAYIVSHPSVLLREYMDAAKYVQLELEDYYGKEVSPATVQLVLSDLRDRQKVVCAANRFSDGKIVLGIRHWDMFMHNTVEDHYNFSNEMPKEHEQGFVDQFGNFLTRKQAMEIARRQGQIKRIMPTLKGDELFSEHLY